MKPKTKQPKKIDKLRDDQWTKIYELREEYRAKALCTEPADRPTTERVIAKFYERIGKPAPAYIWLDGPASAIAGFNVLKHLSSQLSSQLDAQLESQLRSQLDAQLESQLSSQLESQLSSQLYSQLHSQLRSQLESQLRSQLSSQLRSQLSSQLRSQLESQLRSQLESQLSSQLYSQLYSQLWSQLWSQLYSQLSSQLDAQLESQLRSQLGSQLHSQLSSQLDAQLESQLHSQLWSQLGSQLRSQLESQLRSQLYSQPLNFPHYFPGGEYLYWLAFYQGAKLAGVKYSTTDEEVLDEWVELCSASGWWMPFEGLVICAERHQTISFGDDRLLHNPSGPAIKCRDGYTVYAWRGVRVPGDWIERRDTVDPTLALTHENIEQRRALAEILGWQRILEQVPTRVVNEDLDPMIGILLECDLPDAPKSKFLKVKCGTGRTFVLCVPPEMSTALEANAWTYDVEPVVIQQLEGRA